MAKTRKLKLILLRTDKKGKEQAESRASLCGESVSEYIRRLIREDAQANRLEAILQRMEAVK